MEPMFTMPSLKVLAAVSGGMDSMCLASLLLRSGADFGIAHCNFSLRGEESDGDERLVASWAKEHGIPFYPVRFDTTAWAEEHGISIEMAARDLRYAFFAETARKEGYEAVAVAHHADDNAETLVLNLLRGSGSKGLSGMKADAMIPGDGEIRLLRPLLEWTRSEIAAYVAREGIPYREDSTNAENTYKRNQIRNLVFPVFREINPSFVRTLNEDAVRLAEVDAIAEDYYRDALERVCPDNDTVLTEALLREKYWKYLLYRILNARRFPNSVLWNLTEHLEKGTLRSGSSWLSPEWTLYAASGELLFSRDESESGPDSITILETGTYSFHGQTFVVDSLGYAGDTPLKQPEGTVAWDAARLSFPLTIRGWRDGDRFVPFGMRGTKKLQDWFSDRHWTPQEKKAAVLVELEGDRIAAILGGTINNTLRISKDTERIIRITLL